MPNAMLTSAACRLGRCGHGVAAVAVEVAAGAADVSQSVSHRVVDLLMYPTRRRDGNEPLVAGSKSAQRRPATPRRS